jgi:plastocyanin
VRAGRYDRAMRGRLKVAAGLGAVLALALGGAYALADDVISTAPVGLAYSQPTFTITGGQVAQFSNTQGLAHSVTADDTKTLGGRSLFASAIISSGSAAVKGTQYLAPGDYKFHCAIHGPIMSGTLHVAGGTPVARPELTLTVSSAKLSKVRGSGKLDVMVSDQGSDASGIALTARAGKKTIAARKGLRVAAGQSSPVALDLTGAGERALKGRNRVTVDLSGTVDFGKPATTARTLK